MDLLALVARLTLDKTQYDKGVDEAVNGAKSFGDKLKSGLGTAAKAASAAVTAVSGAATAMAKAFIKGTGEVAAYGDNIDKASQKIGFSAQAYQEWDAVLQHSGSSINSLTPALKTLSAKAQAGSDAFKALGISEKEAASMSREQLFERTITALQGVSDETKKATLAQELLGRGAMELGPLLNTSAADTQAMRDRVHELGGVMSNEAVKAAAAYQDSLQDMTTAFDGLKRNLLSEFLPSLTMVMDGLTELFTTGGSEKINEAIGAFVDKIGDVIPKILSKGSEIILALTRGIVNNLPKLVNAAVQAIITFAQGVVRELPMLVKAGMQIIVELAHSIVKALPELIPAVIDTIIEIVEVLTDPVNLSMLIDAAIEIILALVDGITRAAPRIAEAAPKIIVTLIAAIIENAPKLLVAGVRIIEAIIEGMISFYGTYLKTWAQILGAAWTVISEVIGKAFVWGGNIVKSLINGISQTWSGLATIMKALWNALGTSFVSIINAAKIWGGNLIANFTNGIVERVKSLWSRIKAIGTTIGNFFKNLWENAKVWGKDLIISFTNGIWEMINKPIEAVKNLASRVRSFLGFSEPEEGPLSNFHTYAPDMMALFAKGITDNEKLITDAIGDAFNIQPNITQSVGAIGTGQEIVIPRQTEGGKQSAVMMVDRTVFAKLIYTLYNEQANKVGVRLAGVNV